MTEFEVDYKKDSEMSDDERLIFFWKNTGLLDDVSKENKLFYSKKFEEAKSFAKNIGEELDPRIGSMYPSVVKEILDYI